MITIKIAMDMYFSKLLSLYSEKLPPYPRTTYDEDVSKFIYIGEPDEYEWVCWSPVEKTVDHQFDNLSKIVDTNIHLSIVEYYNSYWFCNLGGRLQEISIQLNEVLPNMELETFTSELIGYSNAHNKRIENIPIGIETNESLLIVVNNKTGEVRLEDYETNKFTFLANNLSELIVKLSESL